MEKYNDKTPMPFGKHVDEPLGDVPASYLLWCADQPDMKRKYPALIAYVESGRAWLEKEKENEE